MKRVKTDEWYVAICQYYWGRGNTPEDAVKEMVKAGGNKKKYVVKKCPDFCEEPWVDGMGYVRADFREGVEREPEDWNGKWEVVREHNMN